MFIGENIVRVVKLFDKAVTEGRNSLWKRGRKVTTGRRNIDNNKWAIYCSANAQRHNLTI